MMDLTENLYRYLAEEVCGGTKIQYKDFEIDLGKPFELSVSYTHLQWSSSMEWFNR